MVVLEVEGLETGLTSERVLVLLAVRNLPLVAERVIEDQIVGVLTRTASTRSLKVVGEAVFNLLHLKALVIL